MTTEDTTAVAGTEAKDTEVGPVTDEKRATATPGAAMIPLDRAPFTFKTLTAVANTDFVPAALRGKPNSILASILTGRELGLGPMESLRSIDVIDGRPSPSAEWMVGRVFDAGHIIEVVEQTDQVCRVKGTRYRDHKPQASMEFAFTIEMAARAKLTNKNNWKNYPEAMLYWRAVAQLCRQFFPDAIRGLRHLPEELGSATVTPFGPVAEDYEPEYPEPGDERIVDTETGEILDPAPEPGSAAELAVETGEGGVEYAQVWPPEVTGTNDEVAIARVDAADGEDEVWVEVFTLLSDHDWIEDTMEVIEGHVRFLCRALEYLGVWETENALRDFLQKQNRNHISELKRAELVQFARNVVMRAMAATRKEEPNGNH